VVNVARVVGPAVAAVLISTVTLGWCFIGNAVSFSLPLPARDTFDCHRAPARLDPVPAPDQPAPNPCPPLTATRATHSAGTIANFVPVVIVAYWPGGCSAR
jgi:hypothetical protein